MEEQKNIFRPFSLKEYKGQENLIKKLKVSLSAVKNRKDILGHLLFYGPPGLGKTTIAQVIAHELNSNILTTIGTSIEKSGDLIILLNSLNENDVLFIDEIHSLKPNIEEILYSAMEDFKIDIMITIGEEQKVVKIDLPKFTLIGATTKKGNISKPLQDRFVFTYRMEYYNLNSLNSIVKLACSKINKKINNKALELISLASRGTPRIALNILKKIRDFCDKEEKQILNINEKTVLKTFKLFDINEFGLEKIDLKYLNKLKTENKPLGITTLSSFLNEDIKTIENNLEPFLIEKNYVEISKQGRKITEIGLELLNKINKTV